MDDMDATSKMDLSTEWHGRHSKNLVASGQGRRNVRHYASRPGHDYLVDPHTAVAIAAAKLGYKLQRHRTNDPSCHYGNRVTRKFQESVTVAIGEDAWAE
jgi:hypothetical protein